MSYFWVPSQPYFESFLVASYVDAADLGASDDQSGPINEHAQFSVYDPDGQKINEIKITCSGQTQVTPLEPLLGECKHESGLRHALLSVDSSSKRLVFSCRSHSPLGSHSTGPLTYLPNGNSGFFPFTVEEGVTNILVISNISESSTVARCRLYSGEKSKEEIYELSPKSTRLINIESSLFEAALVNDASGNRKVLQGYVRVGAKGQNNLAVQLLTKEVGAKDLPVFSAI